MVTVVCWGRSAVCAKPPHWVDLSLRNKWQFAQRWGLDLIIEGPRFATPGNRKWLKVRVLSQLLEEYLWLWWVDVDTIITNHNINPHKFIQEGGAADVMFSQLALFSGRHGRCAGTGTA